MISIIAGDWGGQTMAATDVIVGLDDSDSAATALAWAARYARSHQLRLLAVHVSPFLADVSADWTPEAPAHDRRADDDLGPTAVLASQAFQRVHPEPSWGLHYVGGAPGRSLVGLAHKTQLLAVGARTHRSLGRLLAGSVSHYCLSHSTAPVAAVPAPTRAVDRTRSGDIVVGLDDSPSGRRAYTWAAAWARCSGQWVRAVHLLG